MRAGGGSGIPTDLSRPRRILQFEFQVHWKGTAGEREEKKEAGGGRRGHGGGQRKTYELVACQQKAEIKHSSDREQAVVIYGERCNTSAEATRPVLYMSPWTAPGLPPNSFLLWLSIKYVSLEGAYRNSISFQLCHSYIPPRPPLIARAAPNPVGNIVPPCLSLLSLCLRLVRLFLALHLSDPPFFSALKNCDPGGVNMDRSFYVTQERSPFYVTESAWRKESELSTLSYVTQEWGSFKFGNGFHKILAEVCLSLTDEAGML